MPNKNVIEMAREAWKDHPMYGGVDIPDPEKYDLAALERFAALVAAHEREACAKLCEESRNNHRWDDYIEGCEDCAAAIRARGE